MLRYVDKHFVDTHFISLSFNRFLVFELLSASGVTKSLLTYSELTIHFVKRCIVEVLYLLDLLWRLLLLSPIYSFTFPMLFSIYFVI